MNLNKKGFTLIELIASMVILAMLMVVTVPNVIGILAQQKKNAYPQVLRCSPEAVQLIKSPN